MFAEKTRKRELDALTEASEELKCEKLIVITDSQEEKIEWKDREIDVVPIVKFSLFEES